MTPERQADCACRAVGPRPTRAYTSTSVGTDMRNGRYGEVDVDRCTSCGRLWVHYYVIYEAFSRSGRWATAEIDESDATGLTPEKATDHLDTHPHIFGGSYYGHAGAHGRGRLNWDLH